MKKTLTALTLVLVIAMLVAACGGGGSKGLQGTSWTLSSVDMGGQKLTIDEFAALGMGEAAFDLTFNADGKCSLNAFGEKAEGTYKEDGDKVTITVEGMPQVFTVSGDTMSIEANGAKIELKKK